MLLFKIFRVKYSFAIIVFLNFKIFDFDHKIISIGFVKKRSRKVSKKGTYDIIKKKVQ
jgi:hypothetical protein